MCPCEGSSSTGERAVAALWEETDRGGSGRIELDYVVDASSRGGILSRHFKLRRFHDVFPNVAAWLLYWRGGPALHRGLEGAIAVCSIPTGWFWVIPPHDGTRSVGLVTG